MTTVPEYLYHDARRLDFYLDYVGSRIPAFNVTLGLVPKVDFAPGRNPELSLRQKTKTLRKSLTKTKQLLTTRPYCLKQDEPSQDEYAFVFEECPATVVLIPRMETEIGNVGGFRLWVSPPPTTKPTDASVPPGVLFLLEDNAMSPDEYRFSISGYIALAAIIVALGNAYSSTVLSKAVSVDKTVPIWRRAIEALPDFSTRPIESLAKCGCTVADTRSISVLYRVRSFGPDETDGRRTVSTFGYPIFIYC